MWPVPPPTAAKSWSNCDSKRVELHLLRPAALVRRLRARASSSWWRRRWRRPRTSGLESRACTIIHRLTSVLRAAGPGARRQTAVRTAPQRGPAGIRRPFCCASALVRSAQLRQTARGPLTCGVCVRLDSCARKLIECAGECETGPRTGQPACGVDLGGQGACARRNYLLAPAGPLARFKRERRKSRAVAPSPAHLLTFASTPGRPL